MARITPSPNFTWATSSPTRRPMRLGARGARRRPAARWRWPRRRCARGRRRPPTPRPPSSRPAGRRLAAVGRPARQPPALADVLDQLLGDLVEEPRRRVVLRGAEQHAAPRVAHVQPLAGPGDADVGEPPLLLQLLGLGEGPEVREDALLRPDQEHDGELQPLGRVQRHQHDRASRRRRARRCRPRARSARGSRRRCRTPGPSRSARSGSPAARPPRRCARPPARRGSPSAPERLVQQRGRALRGHVASSPSSSSVNWPDAPHRRPADAGLIGVTERLAERARRGPLAHASSRPTVVSPTPRLGTFSTRFTLTSSAGFTTAFT